MSTDGLIASTATTIPSPTPPQPTSTPAGPLLGRSLGDTISLDMTRKQLLLVLGQPQLTTITNGLGTPQWSYANGITIFLTGSDAAKNPDLVWQILAEPPYQGSMVEGFRLGETPAVFTRLYQRFTISPEQHNQLSIADSDGIWLNATFNAAGQASAMLLLDNHTL
ncbi:MAG: hypothetical protein ACLQUY_18270 [Ktedonobacterales bacterium]